MIKEAIVMDKNTVETQIESSDYSLRSNVALVMQHYFANLKGEEPRNVYDFFLDEIEEPLLTIVMRETRNNQSEAARMLGISRGTLRSLLKKFGML
jgi:Fis family transcriptional regulator